MSGSKLEEKTTLQPTIGTILRKRREELGWDEQHIADHLRIRAALIYALEGGDYKSLPGQAYAIGFLKNYASLLGLDAEKLISDFKTEISATFQEEPAKPELHFPQPVEERSLPKWLLITVGLAVVLMAYIGWYHFSSHGGDVPKIENAPLLGGSNTDSSSPVLPKKTESDLAENNNVPADSVSSNAYEEKSDNPVLPAQTAENGAVQKENVSSEPLSNSMPASDSQQPKSPFVEPAPASEPQSVKSSEPALKPDELPSGVIELHFTQDSWTKITDRSGKVLESRLFKSGETWHGDGSAAPYSITAGNAAGVMMKAGAVTSAPLGQAGQVKRNIAVSAEAIVNGSFGRTDMQPASSGTSEKADSAISAEPKNLDQNEEIH